MKCKICNAESGKYPLCRVCNIKKEKGEIIKCTSCGNWHYVNSPCIALQSDSFDLSEGNNETYLYNAKNVLISKSEQTYLSAIRTALPTEYYVFPQINLASFIVKNDDSPFHNELFRNVDFLITNEKYKPLFVIEINDQTHLNKDRKERDEKVQRICGEAGIPIVKFWTSYGVNEEYISKKIHETISSLPIDRIHYFDKKVGNEKQTEALARPQQNKYNTKSKKSGCYVATCVYGSYDCPQVWTLRRFRDSVLGSTWYGRAFISVYYTISPTLVKLFGKTVWFNKMLKGILDRMVNSLELKGFENTPYEDKNW